MVIIIIVVAAFKSSTALTNAYGYASDLCNLIRTDHPHLSRFAVATVMLTTTFLIALQFKYVKGFPALLGVAFFLVFGFFDGEIFFSPYLFIELTMLGVALFWGAAVNKIPEGAWVPLMIGIIL